MKPFVLTPDHKPSVTNRQRGGRSAHLHGKHFQEAVKFSATVHREIIALEELPNLGAKRVGGGKLIPTKICFDFIGVLAGGRAVFFDCKSVGESETSFAVATFAKGHQTAALRRMRAMGAIAGYLIECKERQEYLFLDVRHILDDSPIRFARDGQLCRMWLSLGSVALAVRFDLLAEYYK